MHTYVLDKVQKTLSHVHVRMQWSGGERNGEGWRGVGGVESGSGEDKDTYPWWQVPTLHTVLYILQSTEQTHNRRHLNNYVCEALH